MSKILLRIRVIVFLFLYSLLSISTASASPTKDLVQAYISAYVAVKQPKMNKKDLEHYFSYMDDEITDFHAAYGVTIKGKERKRYGMIS